MSNLARNSGQVDFAEQAIAISLLLVRQGGETFWISGDRFSDGQNSSDSSTGAVCVFVPPMQPGVTISDFLKSASSFEVQRGDSVDTRKTLVLFLVLMLGTVVVGQANGQELNGSAAISSQELLPASTKAWFSIPDSTQLEEKFLRTQIGKIVAEEELKPFMESLKGQFREWLAEQNVRLGIKLENLGDVRTGEICIAGILPNQDGEVIPGSHGIVLLVDVSDNEDKAQKLLDEVAQELTQRGATKEKYGDIQGTKVTKWKFPKRSRLKNHRFAYQTISNGWLLSSNSETVFREIVRRLVNIENVQKGQTLAAQPAFESVIEKVSVEDVENDVLWFVDPFGYVQLAKVMADEEQEFRQRNSDDWGRILRENGFDGFKGIGGIVSFDTADHQILARTFVFRPKVDADDVKRKRVLGLFDFENKSGRDLKAPEFVSNNVSSYFCGTWNMQRALKNIGHAVDTFAKKPGSFDSALNSLKNDLEVDVEELISKFDNEMTVVSESILPINEDSERLAIAVRLKGDREYVIESIKKSWPTQHRVFEKDGVTIVEIDEALGAEDLDIDEDDIIWSDPLDEEAEEEEEPEEEAPSFSVFEKRFCAVTDDYLFVANDEQYIVKLVNSANESSLNKAVDYSRVNRALSNLSDSSKISFRQFARLDRVIRPNYEMMRAGKMVASNTILARLLNHAFATRNKNVDKQRVQRIDGSKLPTDYDKIVAPYLGPSGWVLETLDDGWLLSYCLLEKQDSAQVVKKEDTTSIRK